MTATEPLTAHRRGSTLSNPKSLRIAIDGRCILPQVDGLGTYAKCLIEEIARLHSPHHFSILLQPAAIGELADLSHRNRIDLIALSAPSMRLSQHIKVPIKLAELRPDLYHYLVYDLPFLHRVPCVFTLQDLNFLRFPNYYTRWNTIKRLYTLALLAVSVRRARHVIVPSNDTKQALLKRWPFLTNRVSVVYLGVQRRFSRTPTNHHIREVLARHRISSQAYFLYVGTDRPHKNVDRLIEAFNRLPKDVGTSVKLVLVGCHKYGSPSNAVQSQGNVHRLGYVSAEDLPVLYREAIALTMPSLGEGFGLPALEAMSSGTPVVVSGDGALSEVVDAAGLKVEPTSVESIRHAMELIATFPRLREKLSRQGLERARCFSYTEAARRTVRVYERVAEWHQ